MEKKVVIIKDERVKVGQLVFIKDPDFVDFQVRKIIDFDEDNEIIKTTDRDDKGYYEYDYNQIVFNSSYGHAERVEGGTIYYAEETDNGYCYRNTNAILNRKGVAYIAECVFSSNYNDNKDELEGIDDGLFIADDELENMIEQGGVETFESAYKFVSDDIRNGLEHCGIECDEDKLNEFLEYITTCCLLNADWECLDTHLATLDIVAEWEYFMENEK